MGAASGALAGALAGLFWRIGCPARTRQAVSPAVFVLGLGITGPVAVLTFLKAARLIGGLPYDRVLAAALFLVLMIAAARGAKILGRAARPAGSGSVVTGALVILAATAAGTVGNALAGTDPARARPAPAPATARAGGSPNIILISLDTVRPDHLSAFGYFGPPRRTSTESSARGLSSQRRAPRPPGRSPRTRLS